MRLSAALAVTMFLGMGCVSPLLNGEACDPDVSNGGCAPEYACVVAFGDAQTQCFEAQPQCFAVCDSDDDCAGREDGQTDCAPTECGNAICIPPA